MKNLGYNTKILNGCMKYHVRGLQYADFQEIQSREVLIKNGSSF